MITILGISLTYEALGFFLLFISSELIGMNPKLADNSVCQFLLSFARLSRFGRSEDEQIDKIKAILRGGGR